MSSKVKLNGFASVPESTDSSQADATTTAQTDCLFPGVELHSGFNAVESAFVWSQYRFTLHLVSGTQYAVLVCRYHQVDGTLTLSCGKQHALAYPVGIEIRTLLIQVGIDGIVQAEITPAVQLASDVRELGVMITAVHCFESEPAVEDWIRRNEVLVERGKRTQVSQWKIPLEAEAASAIYENATRASVQNGWAKMSFELQADGSAWVNCALYIPVRAAQDPDRYQLVMSQDQSSGAPFSWGNESGRFSELPHGFCSATLRIPESLVKSGHLDFEVYDTWTRHPAVEWQGGHWRGIGSLPVPDADNRFRVAGPVSPESFCFTGSTWFVKLAQLVELLYGQPISGAKEQHAEFTWPAYPHTHIPNGHIEKILDWGCGCARISRYLVEHTTAQVTGVDIDAQNIAWCQANIPGARFLQIEVDPPTHLSNGEFDLIIGHSVFTHLREADQDKWLVELHRLLRPGGCALVTVMAELAWFACFSGSKTHSQYLELLDRGTRDAGHLDVGVDASSPGYYRNTSHTMEYVHRHWSQFLDVVGIIDGFADFQSLVILRKPIG